MPHSNTLLISNQLIIVKRYFDRRAFIAFSLPLLIYLFTMAPTVYNLDSAEFSTAVATGGIMRATGYPLYLIIGGIWSYLLPIGDVGYRMNLFSALCGALTIALVDRVLRHWQISSWASFGALGMLTCATYFWGMSLIAEVYTFHTVLMVVIMLLLFHWANAPSPQRLGLLTLTVGLSLGHHASTILLIPGCIFFLLSTNWRAFFVPKSIIIGTIAGLIGLSVYLYIPIRYSMAPAFNYAGTYDNQGIFQPVNLQTIEGMWWLVSGQVFAQKMLAYTWPQYWVEVQTYTIQLIQTFFSFGFGPGLLGLIILIRKQWSWGITLLIMFITNAWFYIGYNVIDKKTMFLPTYVIWAIWIGVGYQWLLDWVSQDLYQSVKRRRKSSKTNNQPIYEVWLLRAAIVTLAIFALVWNWQLVNLNNEWSVRTEAEEILIKTETNALIFGWWDVIPPLQYLQLVEGKRNDVQLINRFLINHGDMKTLIKREFANRPVYIDELPTDFANIMKAKPEARLIRLYPKSTQPTN